MIHTETNTIPDHRTLRPEIQFEQSWDAPAVAELIRAKAQAGEKPAFLFIGQKEAALLRAHLAEVFGLDAVASLKDTYYMGLEVVQIDIESFFITGGRKTIRTAEPSISNLYSRRDQDTQTLWQLRL